MPDTRREIAAYLDVVCVRPRGPVDVFEAGSLPQPASRIFGGQLIAQSIMAAGATVDDGRYVHSLHAYFLAAGDPREPLRFAVRRLRDGGSFSVRQVVGSQHGVSVVSLTASFQRPGHGFTHQLPVPTHVPGPDGLAGEFPFLTDQGGSPVELRRVPEDAGPPRPDAAVWMRFVDRLPDEPLLHAASLAYLSDYSILRGAFRAHGICRDSGVRQSSLDHSMWFHHPPTVDGWLLYDIVSPAAGRLRALGTGRLFTRSGVLVTSVAQEGLLRLPPRPGAAE